MLTFVLNGLKASPDAEHFSTLARRRRIGFLDPHSAFKIAKICEHLIFLSAYDKVSRYRKWMDDKVIIRIRIVSLH